MITVAAFAGAAALGAVARAVVGRSLNRHDGLAVGTLVVNVTGSLFLGLLSATAPPVATVLGVGALGAFTTFSSFARDVVALVEIRRSALAAAYVTATLVLGISAAALGVALAP